MIEIPAPVPTRFRRFAPTEGKRAALVRSTSRGEAARVGAGAYVEANAWNEAGPESRHLTAMAALVARRTQGQDLVFSGLSAAVVHGLPLPSKDSPVPEIVRAVESGGRSDTALRVRATTVPFERVEVGGFAVTTLRRTLLDLARLRPLEQCMAALDVALARFPSETSDLAAELEHFPRRNRARGLLALALAEPRSESPGESLSRVSMFRAGLPRPVLQREFEDARGFVGRVDFAWPDHDLVGEFDGVGKYLAHELTGGRSAGEVVVAEKRREDRIRTLDQRVARWGWAEAAAPNRLAAILTAAGLPRDNSPWF